MENISGSSTFGAPCDRRRKTRVRGPISAHVRGADTNGKSFDLEAQLDNLSTGGLYVHLDWQVERGAPLWASFCIPAGPDMQQVGTRWMAQGVILRVETLSNGIYGLAVEFTIHDELSGGFIEAPAWSRRARQGTRPIWAVPRGDF